MKHNPRRENFGTAIPDEFGSDMFQRELLGFYRDGFDELDLSRRYLMTLLIRIERVFKEIEQAFENQPILGSIPPDAVENGKRLDTYLRYLALATELLKSAVAIVKSIQPPEF